jgi:Xaa-Pro aminopeptidase
MSDVNGRVTHLRARLSEFAVEALWVAQPENRRYLSGFTGSAGFLLITPDRAIIATDSRYWEQSQRQAPGFDLVQIKTKVEDHFTEIFERAGHPRRIGFESATVTVDQLATWSGVNGSVEWVATKEAVEPIRAVKDADELAAIRKAVAVTDAGFDYLCGILKPGLVEREAAWELESYLRTHGADALAFESIVAAGPNAAMPHHRSGERAIQRGEPIVIDFGVRVDGYCSDLTRTVSLGRADEQYDEVYALVRRAQQTALDGIRAGMRAK